LDAVENPIEISVGGCFESCVERGFLHDLADGLESDLEGDLEDVVLDAPQVLSQPALHDPLRLFGLAVFYIVPEPNHVLKISYPAFVRLNLSNLRLNLSIFGYPGQVLLPNARNVRRHHLSY